MPVKVEQVNVNFYCRAPTNREIFVHLTHAKIVTRRKQSVDEIGFKLFF